MYSLVNILLLVGKFGVGRVSNLMLSCFHISCYLSINSIRVFTLLYILVSSLLLGDGVEGKVRVSNSALSYGYSKMIFYDFNYNKRFYRPKFYI